MASAISFEELLKKLDQTHRSYLETLIKTHEALSKQVLENAPVSPLAHSRRRRRSTVDRETERPLITSTNSRNVVFQTGDSNISDDISEDDDELYVQDALVPYKFDTENLRDHLKQYRFNDAGKKLLETVVDETGRLVNPSSLFPQYPPDELSHISHYTVFDVGNDGSPVSRRKVVETGSTIDSAIWQAVRVCYLYF